MLEVFAAIAVPHIILGVVIWVGLKVAKGEPTPIDMGRVLPF